MDKYTKDFDYFWGLIDLNINFAFTRYADGEVMLMNGVEVPENTQAFQIDRWKASHGLTKVGKELLETLNHQEPHYYYAISGRNDNPNDWLYLENKIQNRANEKTFVNLWINANYQRTKDKLSNLKREVVLICNEAAIGKTFPFPVKMTTTFPNDCINFWEHNSEQYINYLIDIYGKMENQLFFISCGPVSEIIIHRLYQNNPNNTYIDMGSSLDEFIHGRKTRPYMDPNSSYSKAISHF